MNLLLQEIKKFSRENRWIYIIFLISVSIIGYTNTGNIFEISVIFFLHFLGDIFMMMMGDYYAKNEKKKGGIYQIFSMIVFSIISIYALIFNGKLNYIISQILFGLSSLKAYLDIKNNPQKILNYKTIFLVGLIILGVYFYFELINSFGQFLQIIGFILFAGFLTINDEKIKYFGSLVGIFLIFLSSGLETYNSFLISNIKGIDVSYTLLPLTVFVFYLKNLKSYL